MHQKNEKLLNERVGKYAKERSRKAEHQHNVTIGWHLMKNPLLQSKEALEKNINSLNPHNSQTKETIVNSQLHYVATIALANFVMTFI